MFNILLNLIKKIKKVYFRAMMFLRKILFPIAMVYWLVTCLRNWLYDIGVFKSYSFNTPIIAVGNLSVGGTGKTPHIELLIRLLSGYSIATLSRGYKRESKGFVLADETSSAKVLGDEPFQFYTKFPAVSVAVDANRKNGIEQLQSLIHPDVILLDDAFQHRKVKAGFYILLTTYNDLFCDDYILPFGNLRKSARGKKRANMIIVTKCPNDLSEIAQAEIKKKLKVSVPVYFSCIEYDERVFSEKDSILVSNLGEKLLLAGIAKPDLFFNFLKQDTDETLIFPDHHDFSETDLEKIKVLAKGKKIVTTEKDYMRLKGKLPSSQLYYLPIQSKLLNAENQFEETILNYVG